MHDAHACKAALSCPPPPTGEPLPGPARLAGRAAQPLSSPQQVRGHRVRCVPLVLDPRPEVCKPPGRRPSSTFPTLPLMATARHQVPSGLGQLTHPSGLETLGFALWPLAAGHPEGWRTGQQRIPPTVITRCSTTPLCFPVLRQHVSPLKKGHPSSTPPAPLKTQKPHKETPAGQESREFGRASFPALHAPQPPGPLPMLLWGPEAAL